VLRVFAQKRLVGFPEPLSGGLAAFWATRFNKKHAALYF
jgi:hypothetical protein